MCRNVIVVECVWRLKSISAKMGRFTAAMVYPFGAMLSQRHNLMQSLRVLIGSKLWCPNSLTLTLASPSSQNGFWHFLTSGFAPPIYNRVYFITQDWIMMIKAQPYPCWLAPVPFHIQWSCLWAASAPSVFVIPFSRNAELVVVYLKILVDCL